MWQAYGIGYGQIWQDVHLLRFSGNSYLNTAKKPITVSLGCNGTPGWAYLYVDGVWVSGSAMGSMGIQATWVATAIVPPGSSYIGQCGANIQYWAELR